MGYSIYTKKDDWNSEVKNFRPSASDDIRPNEGYIGNDAMYIYIDIEAPLTRQLLLTSMKLPASTRPDKSKQVEELTERIVLFRQKYTELNLHK